MGQLLTVQVGGVGNNATFSGIISDAGTLTLTYAGSSGTPNLSAVTQISLSDTMPFGISAVVSLSFDDLYAVGTGLSPVPEPSEWAAISFGVLGMVWVAKRRFMSARA